MKFWKPGTGKRVIFVGELGPGFILGLKPLKEKTSCVLCDMGVPLRREHGRGKQKASKLD